MPIKSLIPIGLGMVSIWAFLFLYNLAGFLVCPNWQFVVQAPLDTTGIRTYYNDEIFIETQAGKILCAERSSSNWKECVLPSSPWDGEAAPAWLLKQFEIIPDHQVLVRQVMKVIVFIKPHYFALLTNNQIWGCSMTYSENLEQIVSSGIFLLLLFPIGLGLFSIGWWFNIFIKEGYPVIWDWWGRGKPLK